MPMAWGMGFFLQAECMFYGMMYSNSNIPMSWVESPSGSFEKAANIARLIRAETKLFSLLVQEKKGEQKNERFVQDFKTLADVLIQESLRHDIGTMRDTPELTAELLSQVLDGDMDAAKLLAEEVHRDIKLDERETSLLPHDLIETYENIGIWIDPIDATNEYIKGSEEFDKICHEDLEEEDQVWSAGVHCVTVLNRGILYDTGQPLSGGPVGSFWGLSLGSHSVSTAYPLPPPSKRRQFSQTTNCHFKLVRRQGIERQVEDKVQHDNIRRGRLQAPDSVHLWDLCGPHCILNSLGGGIYSYKSYCQDSEQVPSGKQCRISYDPHQESNGKEGNFVIKGGILGFRDVQIAASVRECILADIPMTPCYEERETVPDYSEDA
ncbi:Inositol polyphosphate 1-phosphatase, partial [Orchesella cincta]